MTDATQAPAAPVKVAPWWWPRMRDVLAIMSTLLVAGSFAALFASAVLGWKVDPAVGQALGQYSGAIVLQWGLVMGFYFGTSSASAAKDATIAAQAAKQ